MIQAIATVFYVNHFRKPERKNVLRKNPLKSSPSLEQCVTIRTAYGLLTLDQLEDRIKSGQRIVGDPDECAKAVQQYADVGCDQIIFGIIVIGLIGLASDLLFKQANRRLFPGRRSDAERDDELHPLDPRRVGSVWSRHRIERRLVRRERR